MKWLRWLPRILTPGSVRVVGAPATESGGRAPADGVDAVRSVGVCESCGSVISVRTRHAAYRGRADCPCGHRNHVEFREVLIESGGEPRHVSVTRQRRFETTTRDPDMRLGFRYGVCPNCQHAVRLLDAQCIARADSTGSVEMSSYYCPTCHLHDDFGRGRLTGHDGEHIVDTLRFQVPPGLF